MGGGTCPEECLTLAEGALVMHLAPAQLVLCYRVCKRWRDALLDRGLCFGTVLICVRLASLTPVTPEALSELQGLMQRSLGGGAGWAQGALRGRAWDVLRFINRPEVLTLAEEEGPGELSILGRRPDLPDSDGASEGVPFDVWLQLASQEPDSSFLSQGAARFSESGAFTHGLRRLRLFNSPPHVHSCVYTLQQSAVRCVAVSPDGTRIASGGENCTVLVWDSLTGTVLWEEKGHTDYVRCVAFSPDSKTLASGGEDAAILLWDAATGERASPPLEGHRSDVLALAWRPDGKALASASADEKVVLWDMARSPPEETARLIHSDNVRAVAYSPGGELVATGCDDGAVNLWSAETGDHVLGPLQNDRGNAGRRKSAVNGVAFSPCGRFVARGADDACVRVYDAETGVLVESMEGHAEEVHCICYLPNGKSIVSGSVDHSVRVWDVGRGGAERFSLKGHTGQVLGVGVSPDGRLAVTCSRDGTVKVWDVECAEEGCRTRHWGKDVWSFACSPCGRYAACQDQRTVRFWDLQQRGRELARLAGPPESWADAPPEIRALGALVEDEVFLGDEAGPFEVGSTRSKVEVKFKDSGDTVAVFVAPEWVNSVSVRTPLIFAACNGGQVVILEAPFLQ